MNLRINYLIVGSGAGIASLASFILVMLDRSFVVDGWMFPLWLSYAAIFVEGLVSFMSLRLASEKSQWLC